MMKASVVFSTFVLMVFLLAISEITSVRGALCEKASQTFSGKCGDTGKCDNQCKDWEHAAHGACHVRNGNHMCFCYFNCPQAEKFAQDNLKAKEHAQDKLNAKNLDNDAKKICLFNCHPPAEKPAQDKLNAKKLDNDAKKVVPNEHP